MTLEKKKTNSTSIETVRRPAPYLIEVLISISMMIICTGLGEAGPAGTPWHMFRQNSHHTGLSPNAGVDGYTTLWEFSLKGTAVGNSISIGPLGDLYFTTTEGVLYSVNIYSKLEWMFEGLAGMKTTPLISDDGTIYVGSMDGIFYAIDSGTGMLEWIFYTGGFPVETHPNMDSSGRIYFSTSYGYVYCLNQDGTLHWLCDTGAALDISSPTLDHEEDVYIGTMDPDKSLVKIDSDGGIEWSVSLPGDSGVMATPAVGPDGIIYIGNLEGVLCALTMNGDLIWSTTLDGEIRGGTAVSADGMLVTGTTGSFLYGIDSDDGAILWELDVEAPVEYGPIVDADGIIYAGTLTGEVASYYPYGVLKENISGGIYHGPLSLDGNGTVYGTIDWKVFGAGKPITEFAIYPNKHQFFPGDTLILELQGENSSDETSFADVKIWMSGPGREVYSILTKNKRSFPPGFTTDTIVYRHTFDYTDPPGSYNINLVLLDPESGETLASKRKILLYRY